MDGRSTSTDSYRYAYNGMEMDNEVSGNGNSYTTEFRQYDARLGRWKSLDPLMGMFPHMSPYVAFDNNPVYYTDIYGLSAGGPGGENPPESNTDYDGNTTEWKTGDTWLSKDGGTLFTYTDRGESKNPIWKGESVKQEVATTVTGKLSDEQRNANFQKMLTTNSGKYNYEEFTAKTKPGAPQVEHAKVNGEIYDKPLSLVPFRDIGKKLNNGESVSPSEVVWELATTIPFLKGVKIVKNAKKVVNASTKIKSINQLQQLVLKGKITKTIKRFDKGIIKGELDHVHFTDGSALYKNGTWKHGGKTLTNKEIKILSENGWTIP